jgi:CheY-like chemotaxis protein
MCNILVVEDHEEWQELIPEKLRRAFKELGYPAPSITVEKTFKEANKLLKEKKWDLLVTDLGLGPRSRQLLGRHLIETANELKVHAIAISGSDDAYNQKDLDELKHKYGAAGFFTKLPFDSKGFIKKVQELVTKPISPIPEIPANLPSSDSSSNCFALLIGIGEYQNINKLSKTVVDAEDLSAVLLENGYAKENIILLRNNEATKNDISQSLDWLARRVKNNDTVIFFFSGHGLQMKGGFNPGEYLCTVQTNLNNLPNTCISDAEFTRALNSINAGRLVVFLDACHSGGIGAPKDHNLSVTKGLSENFYQTLAQATGRAIIAACGPNEVAWELPDMRNGLFTHYLLEGIRGKAAQDGVVTVNSLFHYVYKHVASHDNRQHPYQKVEGGDFMIATKKHFESIIQA